MTFLLGVAVGAGCYWFIANRIKAIDFAIARLEGLK